jgi:hypothetical protein
VACRNARDRLVARAGARHGLPPVVVAPWMTTAFEPPVADQDWVLVLEVRSTEPKDSEQTGKR